MPADPLAVVVPLYNGAAFISETLDSLAFQAVPVSEVIVVDDGSDDDGPEIARSHDLGPRVITQAHQGVAAARNRGALATDAHYVAFLDQDDLWLPRRHGRILDFLDENPDCRALVTTERSFFLAEDRVRLEALGERLHAGADHPDVVSALTLLEDRNPVTGPPAVMRRINTRELLRGAVTVTTSYAFERELFFVTGGCAAFARSIDDWWTLLNVSRLGEIPVLDEPSVLYRIHPSSTTMSTSWPMPLLTSLAAARFGGNLVPGGHERDPEYVPTLTLFWQHQLFALARSGGKGALDAVALAHLLSSTHLEQLSLTTRLATTAARMWIRRRGRSHA
jgi:glycosyltransferase involved in cell wall biosynthesis